MWFALRNHPMALLMPQSGRRPQHQKQTFAAQNVMPALPPIGTFAAHKPVRFVPLADFVRGNTEDCRPIGISILQPSSKIDACVEKHNAPHLRFDL